MLRAPPAALVARDQCCGGHHTTKRFHSGPILNSETPFPRTKIPAIGPQSCPVVVCEVGGSKLASSCKSFGQGGGRVLGLAFGQGEKLGAAVARSVESLSFWLERGLGGGASGNGSGGSGSGGGGGGDFSGDSNVDSAVECVEFREEEDEEDDELARDESRVREERLSPLERLDAKKQYFCDELRVVNVEGMQLEDDIAPYEVLGFSPETPLTKDDITDAKAKLLATGWYDTVTIHWAPSSERAIKLVVFTEDAVYPTLSSFQCINGVQPHPCLLPKGIQKGITNMLQRKQEKATKQILSEIQDRVESWYQDQGYVFTKVKGFRASELSGVLECSVDEGVVSRISVSCEDEAGQPVACYTKNEIVTERLPEAVREGSQWNSGAGKAALKRVEQLGLFDKVNVELAASDSDCGDREAGMAMHLRLQESPRQSADVTTEWSFLCNDAGRPNLRTLQPGGSLRVQHRNIQGLNRTVSGSVTTSNILRPEKQF